MLELITAPTVSLHHDTPLQVATKVEETDTIMAEVELVSQQYLPLAQSCSSIYFTLETLHQVHYLYQYSLHFFLHIFDTALTSDRLTGIKGHNERLKVCLSVCLSVYLSVRLAVCWYYYDCFFTADWIVFSWEICCEYVK